MNSNDEARMNASNERWYFTKEQLENSPSRRCGMDADKELSQRQQAANFIQDMGQRLQVTQLCINTAIVYMHRFYCFHSFTQFHRNAIASAALFLAAKVEEQPRKLEHIIKVAQMCLQKGQPPADRRSELYLEQAQELVINENILLMTLGFDVAIEHPHAFIVKFCHIANASKDLSQTSYFMASNSLHLTTMCLQYKPTVVACFCIHLSCQWSRWQIPKSKENLPWYSYIDQTVTEELLEQLTNEFLVIFDKCPSRLKKKIQNCQGGQNSMSGYPFDPDTRKHNSSNGQHSQSSSSAAAKPGTSGSSSSSGGSRMPSSSSNAHDNLANKLPSSNNAVMLPQAARSSSSHSTSSSQVNSGAGSSSSSSSSQQHPHKSNPHGFLASSAIKPHSAAAGNFNSINSHNAFAKEAAAAQRMEQIKKPATVAAAAADVKPKPSSLSGPPSAVNNNHHASKSGGTSLAGNYRKESAPPTIAPVPHAEAPPSRTSFAPVSHSDIISNVVKEVALAKQAEKQRLSSTVKSEPIDEDVKPSLESLNATAAAMTTAPASSSKSSCKSHSIFSPSPVGHGDSVKSSPLEEPLLSVKAEPGSPEVKRKRSRNSLSSSSGERELIPVLKKVEEVAGYEDIFKKSVVMVPSFAATSPSAEPKDASNNVEVPSHSHKKKKKHKEKDKKHDKEKHRHKEKKKHKEDKHKKEHKEKGGLHDLNFVGTASTEPVPERMPERIKITIPRERLMDIPVKPKKRKMNKNGHDALLSNTFLH